MIFSWNFGLDIDDALLASEGDRPQLPQEDIAPHQGEAARSLPRRAGTFITSACDISCVQDVSGRRSPGALPLDYAIWAASATTTLFGQTR
jgi:hypothetical protein